MRNCVKENEKTTCAPRFVVWDMDGTVLNTLDDLTDAVNHVMRRYGLPESGVEEYRLYFGNGIRQAIRLAVTKAAEVSEETLDEMVEVFREYYDVHCLDQTRPYAGVLEAMKTLKKLGFRMAIVSNKIDSAVQELNARFFAEYVDVAIGEREGVRRKPAPDMVIEALRELGATAEEAVFVGDSEVDYQTAMNAALPCITVLWGFRDREQLEALGAERFAEAPADVVTLLREMKEEA
ncbi:MAG: HAD-IA family hydrolase [Lachnospiraceae bacterium]|nr:HAD-IA family hydrolase [Lachnospiraceae bacterium]